MTSNYHKLYTIHTSVILKGFWFSKKEKSFTVITRAYECIFSNCVPACPPKSKRCKSVDPSWMLIVPTAKTYKNNHPSTFCHISFLLGNSICVASDRLAAATAMMRLTTPTVGGKTTDSMDMLEYPFLTMTKYPMGFILHLGATVAARSVKLLERVPNPDEPEVRDSWWTELRMEIRSHARSLGCNVVLGYAETTTIS